MSGPATDAPAALVARRAIDVHVHITEGGGDAGRDDTSREFQAATSKLFGSGAQTTVDSVAAYYREEDIACVVFAVDTESATGRTPVSSEEVADLAARHADVLIPFGSVDPWRDKVALRSIRRLVGEYGVRGFKFHPSTQAFYPNDSASTRCTRRSRRPASRRSSTPGRPGSAPGCGVAAASG